MLVRNRNIPSTECWPGNLSATGHNPRTQGASFRDPREISHPSSATSSVRIPYPFAHKGDVGKGTVWNRATSIEPSADETYIVVKPFGSYTCARSMEDTLAAHALGEKLGLNRYLMDLEEGRNTDSIADNYEFAKKNMMEEPGFNKRAIVALRVSPDDHSHDFVETVSQNAGLSVRIFRDRNSAEAYLLKHD